METKLRDAASSLDKVHAAHRHTGSKGTNGNSATPLETANTKVQAAQLEVSKYQERYNQAHTRLLEHRTAVLSYSLGRLEAMAKPQDESQAGTSGRNTPAHQGMGMNGGELSPTSGNMSIAQRSKFEGAHLFAGHVDAKLPPMPKHLRAQAQVIALEEQLALAEQALKAAKEEGDELRKEAVILRDENFRSLSGWNDKLQEADDTVSGLRAELQRANSSTKKLRQLEEDKRKWEDERSKLRRDLQEKEEAGEFQIELDRRDGEIKQLRGMLAEEQRDREEERRRWEDEKMEDMARLQQEMETHQEDNARGADVEVDMASDHLRALIKTHKVNLTVAQRRDMSLMSLCDALKTHLDSVMDEAHLRELEKDEWNLTKRRLDSDLKASIEKREKLSQDLDEALREKDALRKELKSLDDHPRVCSSISKRTFTDILDRTAPSVPCPRRATLCRAILAAPMVAARRTTWTASCRPYGVCGHYFLLAKLVPLNRQDALHLRRLPSDQWAQDLANLRHLRSQISTSVLSRRYTTHETMLRLHCSTRLPTRLTSRSMPLLNGYRPWWRMIVRSLSDSFASRKRMTS